MKIKGTLLLLAMLFGLTAFAQDGAKGNYIMLVDALDEPEFYCFDLVGWGEHLAIEDPLQTHTCKTTGGDDQMFTLVGHKIEVAGTDRCLQAAGSGNATLPGAAVLARTCADNPLQDLSLSAGKIKVGDSGLCIGAGTQSTPASGPSHLWRTMIVVDCAATDASLLTWQVGL